MLNKTYKFTIHAVCIPRITHELSITTTYNNTLAFKRFLPFYSQDTLSARYAKIVIIARLNRANQMLAHNLIHLY